jgi:hypothetical protein
MNERELHELRAKVERLESVVGALVRELRQVRAEARVCPLAVGGCQPSPAAGVVEVRYDA